MEPLYLAFELSANTWKLGFRHESQPKRTKVIDIPSGEWEQFDVALSRARDFFSLPNNCQVFSCYEAGRDGFWIHRGLLKRGILNCVVDSSSILVDRRKRSAKSDNIDVRSLLDVLQDHHSGRKSASIVEVPSPEDEDDRHLHRELEDLKGRRTSISNRIKALLVAQGIMLDNLNGFEKQLPFLCDGNGEPLGKGLLQALTDLNQDYQTLTQRKKRLEAFQVQQAKEAGSGKLKLIRTLSMLRGIGTVSAWILTMEAFGWRVFNNRKQAGGYTGLTPTPFQSGDSFKEQGISKAGNARIRWLMVELAHLWVRWQPNSKLTLWFKKRTSGAGKRHKKVVICALARKLFIALWRFATKGIVPEGAIITIPTST